MGGYAAMVSDVSVPANSRDFGKKKRANRSAKLKQCKLDARREQWLSQVNEKGDKVASVAASPPSSPLCLPQDGHGNAKTRRREAERDVLDLPDSDTESASQSPASSTTSGNASMMGCRSNGSSSGSSTRSSSISISDANDENRIGEEIGVLDDWEAVADALSADNEDASTYSVTGTGVAFAEVAVAPPLLTASNARTHVGMKPEGAPAIPRAWRLDDACRPQCLPSLPKQRSLQPSMERHRGAGGWSCHPILVMPLSCPICYEDLDSTDSCFLPCLCGFRICLFCHKRILEADGRCPGCRKKYNSAEEGGQIDTSGKGALLMPLRSPRSFIMNSRS